VELIQFITQKNSSPTGKFLKRDEKQRRTRQMKHRAWKKKKQNFAQKRRKLRKRRRSTISKIRVFNKKLYRILSKKEIEQWWWKTFFPHFQKTTETTWQRQKNKQIQKQLFDLSEQEILARDQESSPLFSKTSLSNQKNYNSLQIGEKDYKPLAIPEALRIREKLIQENILHFHQPSQDFKQGNEKELGLRTESTFQNQNVPGSDKFFIATNPGPFYAGWDENLRKFVLTNRFLARKDCFSFL
jgi:hypothetical protein